MKEVRHTAEVGHSDNYYIHQLTQRIHVECGELAYCACSPKYPRIAALRLKEFAMRVLAERDARSKLEASRLFEQRPYRYKADGTPYRLAKGMEAEIMESYMDDASGAEGKIKHG